ncbi:UNVERIFIED_CONTAM: Ubinuclein-1 [Sesamum latifolium]|uniref:Ubinuclein-1 n=1 Tax=Sesamum latifolium TaxID=2727402 RepID=A0AAW2VS59_9LAMI
MANMGLSAKQEKDDRIQKIKQEVAEMVKLRIPYMKSKIEQQTANSDDFQEAGPEEKEALKRKYSLDDVLENKICDLYDLYVERLEEDSGPPVRKLYEEVVVQYAPLQLAVLWPSGFMDTGGIKRAIYRAKNRKGLCSLRKDRDKIKKKKVLAPKAEDAMNVTQAQHIHEKKFSGSRDQVSALTSKPILSAAVAHGAGLLPVAFANGSNIDKLKQAKKNGSSSKGPISAMPSDLPKKKVKRKPNAEVNEAQFSLEKLVSQGEERRKHPKHVALPLTKSNLQPPSGSAYQT